MSRLGWAEHGGSQASRLIYGSTSQDKSAISHHVAVESQPASPEVVENESPQAGQRNRKHDQKIPS